MSLKKIKLVVFVRENISPEWLRNFVYRILSKRCSFLIPNSKTKKLDIINRTGYTNVESIYPGIDLFPDENKIELQELFDENVNNKLQCLRRFKFVNVGPIYHRKNQKLIVEALKTLKTSSKEVPFVFFVGPYDKNSKYFLDLSRFLKEYELEEFCVFLGELKRAELYRLYELVDAMIISSLSEGLPISLVESFHFKLPVISTKVGGIPEIIINLQNGILIDSTKEELAKFISRLMNDRTLCGEIADNAYKTYEDIFSLENSLNKTEQIFLKVMNSSSRFVANR